MKSERILNWSRLYHLLREEKALIIILLIFLFLKLTGIPELLEIPVSGSHKPQLDYFKTSSEYKQIEQLLPGFSYEKLTTKTPVFSGQNIRTVAIRFQIKKENFEKITYPVLHISPGYLGTEVYIHSGGQIKRIFSEGYPDDFNGFNHYFLELPEDFNGTGYIVNRSPGAITGLLEWPEILEAKSIFRYSVLRDKLPFFIFLLFVFSSFIAILFLHLPIEEKRLFFYFFLFSFFSVFWISGAFSFTFLIFDSGMPFYLVTRVARFFAPVFLLIFYREILNLNKNVFFNCVTGIFIFLAASFLSIELYSVQYSYSITTAVELLWSYPTIIIFIIVFISSVRKSLSGNRSADSVARGFFLLTAFSLVEFSHNETQNYHLIGVLLFYVYLIKALYSKVREEIFDHMEREKQLEIYRLKVLTDRMRPHFLLNSLSMLHALIHKKKYKQVESGILSLSDHYRFLADRAGLDVIDLAEDLSFARDYLQLQKLRFTDTIEIEEKITFEKKIPVPPLTLQPVLENAIQHSHTQKLKIELQVDAYKDGAFFSVKDNGQGLPKSFQGSRTLDNIQRRLEIMYRDVTVELKNNRGQGAIASIRFSGEYK